MDVERILHTMKERPDRRPFRVAALCLALAVLCIDKALGGSWLAFLAAGALILAMGFLLPSEYPQQPLRRNMLASLRAIRHSRFAYRTVVALFAIFFVTVLAARFSLHMGRQFNLSLLPLLLCSFFFGLRVSILAWLGSFFLVYFFVIPPAASFTITSLADFTALILYLYLGLSVLCIPALIRMTSCEE